MDGLTRWRRWTLVDPPVRPSSSVGEIRAWRDALRREAGSAPDDGGLAAALEEAEALLRIAEELRR
ncbi:MAG: hypothetical protein KatS3mg119_1895 [Rhodothalassiaceae bacterium]|nr:MAG: hypothetical protein KatS3mg119_1895 [Rhodothalassiaceae bacterium]